MKRLITLLTLIFLVCGINAQNTLSFNVDISDPSGAPAEGVPVIFFDSLNLYFEVIPTDMNGEVSVSFDVSPDLAGNIFYVLTSNCDGTPLQETYTYQGGDENVAIQWIFCDSVNTLCLASISGNSPNGAGVLFAHSNGFPPYQYTWSTGDSTQFIVPSDTGNYCVTITDALGCIDDACVFVNQINLDSTCSVLIEPLALPGGPFGGTGLIAVSTGTWPFTYQWSNGMTDEVIFVQDTGTYCVTITDATGCSDTACLDLDELPVDSFCHINLWLSGQGTMVADAFGTPPFTYLWNTGDSTQEIAVQPGQEYCVTVTFGSGCVADACLFVDTFNHVDSFCFVDIFQGQGSNPNILVAQPFGIPPYTYAWSTGENTQSIEPTVFDTIYCVEVTDALGCVATACIDVDSFQACSYEIGITNDPNDPFGINLMFQVIPYGTAPFDILWSTGDTTAVIPFDPNLDTLCVSITDATGCETGGCIIFDIPGFDSCLVNIHPICDPGQPLTFYAEAFGVPPLSYQWNTGDTTESIIGDPGIEYCVTVTDASGCVASDCITLDTTMQDSFLQNTIFGFVSTADGEFVDGRALLIEETPAGDLVPVDTFDLISDAIGIDPFYFFDEVEDGRYIVQFIPNGASFIPTYHLDAILWTDAIPIDLPPNLPGFYPIVVHSAQPLMGPGLIDGIVLDQDNGLGADNRDADPLGGALVILTDEFGNPLQHSYTHEDGSFGFSNLPWGTYRVYFNHLNLNPNHMTLEISPTNPVHDNLVINVDGDGFVTSIRDVFTDFEWTLFPNPAKSVLNVEVNGLDEEALITIRDMQGMEMLRRQLDGNQGRFTLDISQLSGGMYTVEIRAGGENAVRKVMVMK